MITSLLRTNRKQFTAMANGWLAAGASAYAVWAGGAQIAGWPDNTLLDAPTQTAPIRIDSNTLFGELRVTYDNEIPGAAERLQSEALMIASMYRLERDLNSMTAELINAQDQLLAMYDLTQATRNYLNTEQILKQLAFETTRLVKVEGAFLLLHEQNRPLRVAFYPKPIVEIAALQSYLTKLQTSNHELLINDKQDGSGRDFHNLLLMPIRVPGSMTAVLGLVNKLGGDFTSPNIKLARAIAEHAGARIENLVLYQENLERAKMQTEMELAQRVQLNLLPQESPQVAGLDLWAGSRPASQVGGDFFDFIARSGRPLLFTVGDVSGKGMPAALLMTMMRTVIRTKTNSFPTASPELIMSRSNEELYDDFTDLSMFATVFVGQYEPRTRELVYANAGHSPVIFCPVNGKARLLEADGTAIGILPTSFSEDQRLQIRPGDLLVVATDGLNEARNARDELFGYERLLQLVESLATKSAQEVADAVLRTVSAFSAGQSQDDDQTLLVLKGVTE